MKKNDIQYECGAERFNENHTKLLSLIKELNLEDKMLTLSKDFDTKLREYKTDYKLNLFYLLDVLKKKYHKYEKSYLQNITLFQFLIEIFDNETAEFIKDSLGFDSEFLYLNADAAFIMFENDLFTYSNYYYLKDGLSEIITKMESALKKYKNVTILKNNELKNIFDDKIETSIDTYYYKNLILAMPQYNLKKIEALKDFELLNSVKPINLLRIYAVYPVGENGPWFKDIIRTTTHNYLRYIIPINYETGLIMISYTDSISASMLSSLYSNGEEVLMKSIHKEIKDIFDIEPPKAEKVFFHNWGDIGVHLWKPGNDINKLYNKIMKPDESKNIFICGEAYSKKQCWMEGALETCYDVIKKLNLKGIEIIYENK